MQGHFYFSLKDETQDIREDIALRFIECGQRYYDENEEELQKLLLVEHELPVEEYYTVICQKRPTLGCRALVQRSLRMIQIVMMEMQDWKEEVRLHSLKLLWQFVLHAEQAFTCKFTEIFPNLARCCQDTDKGVVAEAERVAELMGRLLEYEKWFEYACEQLKTPSLGVLRCFTALFKSSSSIKRNDVEKVAEILANPSICQNLKETYQRSLLDLCENLIDLHLTDAAFVDNEQLIGDSLVKSISPRESSNPNEERLLVEILIKTIALSRDNEDGFVNENGKRVLEKLARSAGNLPVLYGRYVKGVIDSIEDLDCEHSERSESILILFGCIAHCGFQPEYLESMKHAINLVLTHSTPYAKVKIFSGISMVRLLLIDFLQEIDQYFSLFTRLYLIGPQQ